MNAAIPERLVVLGASGFIGSALLRQVAQSSQPCEARVLVHRSALRQSTAASLHHGSLEGLPEQLLPRAPHVIFHCAFQQLDDGSGFAANLRGIEALGAALNEHTRAIVFVSSYSIYGEGAQRDVTETAEPHPASALARSRVQCELRLTELARTHGCRLVISRTRFVIGRGDRFVLPGIAKLLRAGWCVGSGAQRFSVIDVDDLACVLLTLGARALHGASSAPTPEIYNVAYRQPISMNEICAELGASLQLPAPRRRVPVHESFLRVLERVPLQSVVRLTQRLRLLGQDHYGDIGKLQRLLGAHWLQSDPRQAVRRAAPFIASAGEH